jgi:CDGSH-type Zn-finger protein
MSDADKNIRQKVRKITVVPNGPYLIEGGIPLVRKVQVVSEYGEPLAWKTEQRIETKDSYSLCRCGKSTTFPFCDGTHRKIHFDGAEMADTHTTTDRRETYPEGTNITISYDPYLCMNSGFCRNRDRGIEEMLPDTDDSEVRELVMAMIERCPSGSYTYSIQEGDADIEPDYPQQIALTTEVTSDGPIEGPLWVTGNIPIERSDGQPFEIRNRVTLCSCGHSLIKPLCDGTHRTLAEEEAKKKSR